jgi:hypothetical protein
MRWGRGSIVLVMLVTVAILAVSNSSEGGSVAEALAAATATPVRVLTPPPFSPGFAPAPDVSCTQAGPATTPTPASSGATSGAKCTPKPTAPLTEGLSGGAKQGIPALTPSRAPADSSTHVITMADVQAYVDRGRIPGRFSTSGAPKVSDLKCDRADAINQQLPIHIITDPSTLLCAAHVVGDFIVSTEVHPHSDQAVRHNSKLVLVFDGHSGDFLESIVE